MSNGLKFGVYEIDVVVFEIDHIIKQIANDWFGVVEDSTRRTLIQDGLEGIKEAQRRGEQYNVVFLDACHPVSLGQEDELLCPVPSFLALETLNAVRSILMPGGAFVVNVLARVNKKTITDETEREKLRIMERQLMQVFPVCTSVGMIETWNYVITCLPYTIPADELHERQSEWKRNRHALMQQLNFPPEFTHIYEFRTISHIV
ncbi:methyltransferase-like protein 13 [Ditylenchus destructor]|uniref:Methyltransferase-like protein 13 n=1 Tax=Ditylenchus destructor TaxID=166010 RepID=A0AAD4MRP8_9BILA|nr:methyltransferase-like protein 13 [Ditylenchus destructor]